MKKKILALVTIIAALTFFSVVYVIYSKPDNIQENKPVQAKQLKQLLTGQVKKDIGPLPSCSGSITQAKAILELIAEQPGKNEYQIYYKTEADEVTFTSNLNEETIIRIHKWSNEYSTLEQWQGYVIQRLKSAASGETLNKTPAGEISGTLKSVWQE